MANIVDNSTKKKYEKSLKRSIIENDGVVSNLLIHENPSPYKDVMSETNWLDDISSEMLFRAKMGIQEARNLSLISELQEKEKAQMEQLVIFCCEQLKATNPELEQELKVDKERFDTADFQTKLIIMNKIYSKYLNSKYNKIFDENGKYNYQALFSQAKVKELMERTFNNFVKIFTNEDVNSNQILQGYDKLPPVSIKNTKENFNKFMTNLQAQKNRMATSEKWDLYGIYENIIHYCNGRGLTFINFLENLNSKNKISFETTVKNMISLNGSKGKSKKNLNELYQKAGEHNIHTTIYSDKKEQPTLWGSFKGSIQSPNKSGPILEYLDKYLFDNKTMINLNGKNTKVGAEVTGIESNVLGKQQKEDLLISFGIEGEEHLKTKQITNIDKSGRINKNSSQIGLSIKNYDTGTTVGIHSGGNLDSIANFLKTYNKLKDADIYYDLITDELVKYLLINEYSQNDSSKFIKALKISLAQFGMIFALTPFITEKDNKIIDESVDFFVIDQALVPASVIMVFANDALNFAKSNNIRTSKSLDNDAGFSVTMSKGPTITNDKLRDYSERAVHGSRLYDNVGDDSFLKVMKGLGTDTYKKITFSIHMKVSFRNALKNFVTTIKV